MVRKRELNQSQLDILLILYRFRFGTRSLLAEYLHKPNNTSLYSKVTILEKHGLIASRYDNAYRLAGREAEYYVTPKGIRALADPALPISYKDKSVSSQFVQQTTLLFRIHNILLSLYPSLQFFTARDIQALDYFPSKRPTAFISYKEKETTKRFFVEYVPAHLSISAIKSKLRQYIRYYEEDAWTVTDTPFPVILYIAEDGMTEQGVRWHMSRELYKTDTAIKFYTTTQKALLAMTENTAAVWTDLEDKDELLTFSELSD